METGFIVMLVCSVVGFFGSLFLAKSIANNTGKDLYTGFTRKVLMIAGGLGIAGFLSIGQVEGALPVAFLLSIGSLVLLFLMNFKKEVSIVQVIIISVLEALSGLIMLIVLFLSIITKMMGSGVSSSINFDEQIKENARKYNEALKEQSNEEAEAYARSMGFSSADEAAAYRMGPGTED